MISPFAECDRQFNRKLGCRMLSVNVPQRAVRQFDIFADIDRLMFILTLRIFLPFFYEIWTAILLGEIEFNTGSFILLCKATDCCVACCKTITSSRRCLFPFWL